MICLHTVWEFGSKVPILIASAPFLPHFLNCGNPFRLNKNQAHGPGIEHPYPKPYTHVCSQSKYRVSVAMEVQINVKLCICTQNCTYEAIYVWKGKTGFGP